MKLSYDYVQPHVTFDQGVEGKTTQTALRQNFLQVMINYPGLMLDAHQMWDVINPGKPFQANQYKSVKNWAVNFIPENMPQEITAVAYNGGRGLRARYATNPAFKLTLVKDHRLPNDILIRPDLESLKARENNLDDLVKEMYCRPNLNDIYLVARKLNYLSGVIDVMDGQAINVDIVRDLYQQLPEKDQKRATRKGSENDIENSLRKIVAFVDDDYDFERFVSKLSADDPAAQFMHYMKDLLLSGLSKEDREELLRIIYSQKVVVYTADTSKYGSQLINGHASYMRTSNGHSYKTS
jgi:hypothetical protein